MGIRRIARVAYIALFVAVQYGTDAFAQSSLVRWAAIGGLIVVFFDAVICARRRLRVLRAEMADGETDESDPTC